MPAPFAKFHLEKLVQDELLEVEHRRPPGRGGPGAGRPAKFYGRSARELAVSLPERRYDPAGRLLARAVSEAVHDHIPVGDALGQAARHTGRSAGRQARRGAGHRPGRRALLAAAREVLGAWGYEPRIEVRSGFLANCPFHALAQEFTDLVCTMNLELMGGLVDGLELTGPGRLGASTGRQTRDPTHRRGRSAPGRNGASRQTGRAVRPCGRGSACPCPPTLRRTG